MSEPQKESANASAAPTPKSAEQFITASPLFVEENVYNFLAPAKISFDCPGERCRKETTWEKLHDSSPLGSRNEDPTEIPDSALKSVAYRCGLCGKEQLTVVYRETGYVEHDVPTLGATASRRSVMPLPPSSNRVSSATAAQSRKVRVVAFIMKVGQYPSPSIYVPLGLQQSLGKDATKFYRKALLSRNSGYGLAAVAYMRRVVEDKTNELIEVAAKYAEQFGADADTVARMRAAIDSTKYTRYEDKLKIAATVFPDNLKVGDINPLQILFRDVSKGLHGLSEEECLETADEIRAVFEYVFENLRTQVADRKAFTDKVKKLA